LVEGDDPPSVLAMGRRLAGEIADAAWAVTVLGPAPLHRLRGRTRRALLIRADGVADARGAALAGVERVRDAATAAGVRIVIDVDPQTT
jgi:primosomal protein N'